MHIQNSFTYSTVYSVFYSINKGTIFLYSCQLLDEALCRLSLLLELFRSFWCHAYTALCLDFRLAAPCFLSPERSGRACDVDSTSSSASFIPSPVHASLSASPWPLGDLLHAFYAKPKLLATACFSKVRDETKRTGSWRVCGQEAVTLACIRSTGNWWYIVLSEEMPFHGTSSAVIELEPSSPTCCLPNATRRPPTG